MSDWIDVKTEDSRPHFPDLSGTDPSIYLPPIEPPISATQNVSLLPETEQVIRSHSRPAATPSERQRTVQACDKCRERKTKCSGDHPVCQRCTTRGLICQYSSREPRTRGPSKARLRNAVSSADLRSTTTPRVYAHGSQPSQQIRSYQSQTYDPMPDYRSLRRVSSIPATLHTDGSSELAINSLNFGTMEGSSRAVYTPPYAQDRNGAQYHRTPPFHYPQSDPRTSQLRDMRRVQSHSTLIGSRGGTLTRNTPSYPSFRPADNFSGQTYPQPWARPENISPSSMSSFERALDRLVPPGTQAESTLQPSPKVHPWGYQSDGSTGSEPVSNDVNIEYSPASSEDIPEPQSGQEPFANYSDPNLDVSTPSQGACTPQYLNPPLFVTGDHFNSQGVIVRPPSDSDMHTNYEQYAYR